MDMKINEYPLLEVIVDNTVLHNPVKTYSFPKIFRLPPNCHVRIPKGTILLNDKLLVNFD